MNFAKGFVIFLLLFFRTLEKKDLNIDFRIK